MPIKTVQDLFVEELRDIYHAEKQITKAFERRTYERRPTEAVIDVDVLWKHDVTVRLGAVLQRRELTLHRCLLRLFLRRNSRINRDRLHDSLRRRL